MGTTLKKKKKNKETSEILSEAYLDKHKGEIQGFRLQRENCLNGLEKLIDPVRLCEACDQIKPWALVSYALVHLAQNTQLNEKNPRFYWDKHYNRIVFAQACLSCSSLGGLETLSSRFVRYKFIDTTRKEF